jgi:regulatory protein
VKITAIRPQVGKRGRYSIFLEGKYAFSLSDIALLDSRLVNGQELSQEEVTRLTQTSLDDKIYFAALSFLAIRLRTKWEVKTYLQRKKASPTLSESILSKLSNMNLIDDRKFAQSFVDNRRLLKPTSRRKLTLELRQKHVAADIIEAVLGTEQEAEHSALSELIARKRKQSRYQDNLKLMQYLAGQGFNYGDIKTALHQEDSD